MNRTRKHVSPKIDQVNSEFQCRLFNGKNLTQYFRIGMETNISTRSKRKLITRVKNFTIDFFCLPFFSAQKTVSYQLIIIIQCKRKPYADRRNKTIFDEIDSAERVYCVLDRLSDIRRISFRLVIEFANQMLPVQTKIN